MYVGPTFVYLRTVTTDPLKSFLRKALFVWGMTFMFFFVNQNSLNKLVQFALKVQSTRVLI